MGHYLDGRVTAVLGTHTHVQTVDARVLPRRHRLHDRRRHDRAADSVIGVRTDVILRASSPSCRSSSRSPRAR